MNFRTTYIAFMLVACIALGGLSVAVAQYSAMTFNHDRHVAYMGGMDCATCHGEGLQQITPDPATCVSCHGNSFMNVVTYPGKKTHGPAWALNHGPMAKAEVMDCMACHQEFTDKARKGNNPRATTCYECHTPSGKDTLFGPLGGGLHNVHGSDFRTNHSLAARTDQRLCASCHTESRFCADCHNTVGLREGSGINPHRFHEYPSAQWARGHATEARKNLATCQACHPTGNTCIKCHSDKR
ncbi:cytochrome c family protein [Desulfurispirillum indicum]|uniref:cytochrome c3 family protein n=1 Tax=Desulfurispirillum indicum TaxID=936456 RepID=UPI001CFBEBE6|nr:cytochrome c3 family protein [Desulfurispirillum indicum]UCZ56507.1 cytochrome c family protein [Desulfurispirillum indicum]